MLSLQTIRSESDFPENITRNNYIDFLFTHLDRFGDPKPDIERCLDYAFSTEPGMGGFCLAAMDDGELVGALIMNRTGMGGYIPENILVYVAVRGDQRGKGVGRRIIERGIELADGDVKLHVEYDNPAKRLYERIGFANKYADMRFSKGD